MTRKRRGESLMGILTETCPHCAGLGRVRRPLTIALKLEREAYRLVAENEAKAAVIRVAGSVADILIGDRGARAAALEKRAGVPLYIRADHSLDIEEHELLPSTRAEAERLAKVFGRGDEVVLDRVDSPEPGGGDEVYGWADGYRVLVEGARSVKEGAVIVLTEAGMSLGRGHVKGSAPPAPSEKSGARKAAASRKRRRPRRKPKRAKDQPGGGAAEKGAAPPEEAAGQGAGGEAAADRSAAPEGPKAAKGRKRGLLRRGARKMGRALR
jgi:ribonuclease E